MKKKKNDLNNPELKSAKGIELFMPGKWNGDRYTNEDIDSMLKNFGVVEVPLKIGHDNEQKFAGGEPAFGWIEKIYKVGEKLFADIKDVPKLVADAINAKAYKKISAEIIWDSLVGGKFYDRMLAGAAILGGDLPALNTLADLPKFYEGEGVTVKKVIFDIQGGEIQGYQEKFNCECIECGHKIKTEKHCNTLKCPKCGGQMRRAERPGPGQKNNKGDYDMDWEKLAKEYKEKVAELKAEIKTYEQAAAEKDTALAKAEADKKVAEDKAAEEKKAADKANEEKDGIVKENALKDIKVFTEKLVTDKKIAPTMKDRVVATLEAADNAKKYEIAIDKDNKENLTARENLMKTYEAYPAMAIFGEFATEGDHSGEGGEDSLTVAARKYAKENKVSLSKAYAHVAEQYPQLRKKDPVAGSGK